MKKIALFFNWITSIFLVILFALSVLSGHYLPAIIILITVFLTMPPFKKFLKRKGKPLIPGVLSFIVTFSLFIFSIYLLFTSMGNEKSIYKSPEIENKLMNIYSNKMALWPEDYEEKFIDTQYGKVYVIVSGPKSAPPLILLHASAMSSWSWLYNVKELNKYFRTFAIDTIGDAGRSELIYAGFFPENGQQIANLYSSIMDSLDIDSAPCIGASQGGFIATNLALYYPDKVDKLVLCGPMGYTGTTSSVLRIIFTALFPIKPVRESSTRWAFGDDPYINEEVGEWFETILSGVLSRQPRPMPFTLEELKSLNAPVLLLLGTKDGLVGNPQYAIDLVKDIPYFRTETLETGHLISAEKPEEFNKIVLDFLN